MSRVACPHCGFQNFAISAYCGRCERPLPKDPGLASPTPPPAPRDRPARITALPTVIAEVERTVVSPPEPTRTPPPAPRLPVRAAPTPPPPAPSVPAPLPPLSLEAAPLPEKPIELGKGAHKKPRGPDLGDLPDQAGADVPVQVPSVLRLLTARLVDAAVVLGAGGAWTALEIVVRGEYLRLSDHGVLDRLAEWLSFHGQPVLHGAFLALLVGTAYGVYTTYTTGQTLGRKLTDTVLVRRSGKPMSWLVIVVRAAFAIVSALLFGAGFLWPVVDPFHRTWHDLVSGTVVVRRYVRVGRSSERTTGRARVA
jgi:uncharacterized RDD family membrane protein YckC